jgi:hypothetical protein
MRFLQTCPICFRDFYDEFLKLACDHHCEDYLFEKKKDKKKTSSKVEENAQLWKGEC